MGKNPNIQRINEIKYYSSVNKIMSLYMLQTGMKLENMLHYV
jgi:hypothetical protein